MSHAPDTGHAGPSIVVTANGRRETLSGQRPSVVAYTGRLMVLVEVGFERKRLATSLARVQLERRVRLHVSTQVGSVGKGLAAVRAAEWFFAGVRAQVSLQQPRP